MQSDPYLANVTADMTAYLILERALCACEALCTCRWDDEGRIWMDILAKIIRLLDTELTQVRKDAALDREYTSLDGNGCNSIEVESALEPIVERVHGIVDGKDA